VALKAIVGAPVGPEPAQGDPEEAILGPESSALVGAEVDGQLLAQGGVLEGQGGPGLQGSPKAGDQRYDECAHGEGS